MGKGLGQKPRPKPLIYRLRPLTVLLKYIGFSLPN